MVITPVKSCVKPCSRPSPHLVDVVDHAAHKVAVGMAVDKAERHAAELIARLHTHVAHRFVGQAVDAIALQPLEGRSTYDDNRELGNERQQRIEVHLPGGDDKVDALANENGRVELQNHRDGSTQKRCRKRDAVRTDIAQQAAGHRTHGDSARDRRAGADRLPGR